MRQGRLLISTVALTAISFVIASYLLYVSLPGQSVRLPIVVWGIIRFIYALPLPLGLLVLLVICGVLSCGICLLVFDQQAKRAENMAKQVLQPTDFENFARMRFRFDELARAYAGEAMTGELFVEEAAKLQIRAPDGVLWAIDMRNGSWVRFNGKTWDRSPNSNGPDTGAIPAAYRTMQTVAPPTRPPRPPDAP